MFVHPSTSHFSRTYHHIPNPIHTTSRKNLDKENAASGLPSKTPSRAGLLGKAPGTSIRVGLGPKIGTAGGAKDGNALGGGGAGGGQQAEKGEKGKGDAHDIEPKRLFASTTKQALTNAAPTQSKSHKTPGPRRQVQTFASLRTPAPSAAQIPNFVSPTHHLSNLQLSTTRTKLNAPKSHSSKQSPGPTPLPSSKSRQSIKPGQPSPGPTPLPSAARTRRRSRQSLTPSQPEFQTPNPRWEEEHSLGSITEGPEAVDLGGINEVEELDEEMDDEPEYMPPSVQELPWEPPFEMPDQASLAKLASVPPLWQPGGPSESVQDPDLEPSCEETTAVRLCDEEMLEEPEFRRLAAKPSVMPVPRPIAPPGAKSSRARLPVGRGPLAQTALARKLPGAQSSTTFPRQTPFQRPIARPLAASGPKAVSRMSSQTNLARPATIKERNVTVPEGPAFNDLEMPLLTEDLWLQEDFAFDLGPESL
ncbi:hypothetical protein BD324DRAFT_681959 [Kockovaella imperatae]|uniref:Uncharacterized protein n=1 Tax=Kockovaella imperatae TaxID=4999 RepID=A0A1Y1UHB6_9TREE|nr:hypothetical protein BD324DRAFT_681959 [Kockovaella imperatae]ORX36475.1 hypothetical protein BD324DRAFT_681959 [Kockovaella imperatae]